MTDKELNYSSEKSLLSEIKELQKETVRMRKPDEVLEMLEKLIDGGKSRLQVITDFDMTLTKQHHNGNRCPSSYGIFDTCSNLPTSYKKTSALLYEYYHQIEIDPLMSVEEKIPHMCEWYMKSQDLLKDSTLRRDDIALAVKESDVCLREGSKDMLSSLCEADVPVLVFSAGVGDVVEEVLKQKDALLNNMKIISNYFEFENGKVGGFKGGLIHMFNKNEKAVENNSYFKELTYRNNVILLGDMIGDCNMAEGVHDPAVILKIGFLYDKIEERLPKFLENFDIVLIDDQTMDVANGILRAILNSCNR